MGAGKRGWDSAEGRGSGGMHESREGLSKVGKQSPGEPPRVKSLRRSGAPTEEGVESLLTCASRLSGAEGEAAGGARPGARGGPGAADGLHQVPQGPRGQEARPPGDLPGSPRPRRGGR